MPRVGAQLPRAVREARKPLYPKMEEAIKAGKQMKFINKTLFINNVEYKPENAEMEHEGCQEELPLNILSWNVHGLKWKITDLDF